ncbi:hypothetical protein Rs2_32109 [Raphanus sativus]|uniref:Protein GRAVITROPIC IN THE LIGHT 1 n=1 Tax=Raphanus sativus TaxID=3726 RepID=A0A6J0K101_RAPSA|nr:protein GRAVITROPIC IN THE LIGHT 1 [Raphanus sativus]KAJ4892361.1 hypothetical protein Rs2_32109 [Raphanus sativus]
MLPSGGLKETQLNNNQKVHPQPMEQQQQINQNPEAMEALISNLFGNISSLKSAYIQLQSAHTPYDPDKIQEADKAVISELKNLSELKHHYREHNPKPVCVSPQDSRLAAEIQEQQSLLKTYEVMVKKFQSEIQNKDSEITQMMDKIEEANQKRVKLEKNLKLRGMSNESSSSVEFPPDLTVELFISTYEAASKAVHDFSKPLINMMKAAGWDLDSAANSIEPEVDYAKRPHKKYAFESYICQRMFGGFQRKDFSLDSAESAMAYDDDDTETFFRQFLSLKDMDPLDALCANPDSNFGKFCRSKYLILIHPKMEASFFGNLDQRDYVAGGGHPRTGFYQAFLKLAKSVWVLHRLAYSFDPAAKIFQVKKGSEYSDSYMESVLKNIVVDDKGESPRVGLMVMPGFWIGGSVVQSRVYVSGVKVVE